MLMDGYKKGNEGSERDFLYLAESISKPNLNTKKEFDRSPWIQLLGEPGRVWECLYRLVLRRNSVYVIFVVVGAFLGERAVDYGVHKVSEYNNVGKRYEDKAVLGQRQSEE